MIVWVSSRATGFPNDQRFEVVSCDLVKQSVEITVKSCGSGEVFKIKPKDIVGCEISESFDIKFGTLNWSFSEYSSTASGKKKAALEAALKSAEAYFEKCVSVREVMKASNEITMLMLSRLETLAEITS